MSYYLAPSLDTLRDEINARWPGRDKKSDGWIGDIGHQGTTSDHNPNSRGSVNAIDIDEDGIDLQAVFAAVKKHPAARYWIYERKLYHRLRGWKPEDYKGTNPHDKHAHLSIEQDRDAEQDRRPWGIAKPSKPKPSTPKPSKPTSKPAPTPHYAWPLGEGRYFGPKGGPSASVSGYYGRRFKGKTDREWLKLWGAQMGKRGWSLKSNLPSGNDGFYGPEYARFVKKFQADQGLRQDGKLGPQTWRAAFENPVR